jgi:uncharacterized alpha-E superfamily protein
LISRVADSCFWMMRYLERVDTWSRMLEITSSFSLDVDLEGAGRWRPLIIVVGQEADFLERIGEDEIENGEVVQRYLVWDDRNPYSLFSSKRAARENARTIREVMSVEMWEAMNEGWLWLNSRSAKRLYDRERDAFYQRLRTQCMLFYGTCYSTMLHEDPYTFMTLGRAVERIGQTARLLDVRHHALHDREDGEASPVDALQWLAILRSCSAYEPFFKRASHVLSGSAVAQFMLFDRTFPRAILHNLDRVRGFLLRLRDPTDAYVRSPSWEALERMRGSLLQMDIDDVRRIGLHETLTWIVEETAHLCEAIHDEFLDPPLDMLRARVVRDGSQAAARSRSQAGFSA